ncbi:MAG: hypothetical protein RLZZ241_1680 [Bacteroidota bacterium]|jgi:ring-1,2-phenylacetyl-CoA epoxidase subunit PaaE
MSTFYPLRVSEVNRLTPDAVSVSLEVPVKLREFFSFKAGQYITVKHRKDGEEIRRAYSIASDPQSENLVIGIKEVPEGTFSTFANRTLQAGDTLEIMPPEGRFVFPVNSEEKNILAIAAGSGITPILSIIKEALVRYTNTSVVLLYGNRSLKDTMFRETLNDLLHTYPERFTVHYVFSRTREDSSLFGRIGSDTINYVLRNKHKDIQFNRAYLCGPQELIQMSEACLEAYGLNKGCISHELFTELEVADTLKDHLDGKTQLSVTLDGVEYQLVLDQKALVLDGVLKQKIDAPYSCQGGVCSSCIARVTEGEAQMVKNQILTPGEIAEGLILTCQAHAVTPTLKIDFDDV